MRYGHLALTLALVGGVGLAVWNSFSSSWYGSSVTKVTLTSFDEKGQARTFKINDVQLDPQDNEQEIYLYTVLYQGAHNRNGSTWHNLCLPDADGMAKAIPLSGRWDVTGAHIDDGSITFACTNGAVAKCVRWGYKPWKTLKGESLRDYHQACTRMVRADYCGNGTGHTQNGTAIDVYDRLGVQQRTQDNGMAPEASWDANGVVNLKRTRFQSTFEKLQQNCPEKLSSTTQVNQSNTQALKSIPTPLLFNDSFIQSQSP
ncbi:secreted protein [Leptolyngbya sp. Heron Island J]|uniref:ADYC domain-containing protein n=1 Tax=Leptolyngbya sp. Heron Island J TaxID=1385935 RepID=UPI0003B94733|nr:ADYC domain-containing protein [Leptolyngbya sp. Heron Island J]ESA37947.1 secreted protein [Leptolyngbya sp. Heron Island J]